MTSSRNAWLRAFALSAFLIVFATAFFRLPYYFAVPPSVSASYVFQYNNRVATLIFLAGAAAFAILFRGLSIQPATRDSRVSQASALLAAVCCVALGLFYWWISSPDGLVGENIYFYSRLTQLAAGKTIYRDFEFAYGPLLLYLPFWIGKLLHLSLINGYVIFWLVDWAVGIWILYRLVNAIEIPSPYRTAIFFLFAVDFSQALWPQGINYAPIRALATAGLAMLVFALHKRRYPIAVVVGVAVVCATIVTGMSPEHGLAFMLGTSLFFVLCVKQRPDGYWPSIAAMSVTFLAIAMVSERFGLYATLRAFSSGGNNYPIMPYPGVVCVMGLYLVAACVAYLAFQRKQTESLTIYLLCICLFALPSGFGRADSGHMQLGAFSALIVAALALGKYPRIALLAGLAFLYWPATAQYHSDFPAVREQVERRVFDPSQRTCILYRPTVLVFHLLHRDAHRETIENKVALYYSSERLILNMPDGAIVNSPWGMTRHGFADDSGKVDYGYFYGTENVILPSRVDFIIQWLQAHPERKLILSTHWELECRSQGESHDVDFRTWHGFHWASPKHQIQVFFPLCDFIESHYAPDEISFSDNMQLWHPIAAARPSVAASTSATSPPSPLKPAP